MKTTLCFAFVLGCLAPLSVGAVELCWIFNRGMVLQADRPVPVWGQGTPGETVTVSFAGQTVSTQVDAQGEWAVKLAPLAASAVGRTLSIEAISGARSFPEVLVGDVWVCGGQSNMASPALAETTGGDEEAAKPANPLLRVFTVPQFRWSMEPQRRQFPWVQRKDGELAWGPTNAQTYGVPYYFGTALQPQAGRPLGLIVTPVGASSAEAWIPMADLETLPWLQTFIANSKSWAAGHPAKHAAFQKSLAEWNKRKATAKAAGKPFTEKSPIPGNDPGLWPRWWASALYNAHIAPLRQFSVRGVIWYQGENNTHSISGQTSDGPRFVTLMETLIGAWRRQFDQPELPFLIVQLSMFGRGSSRQPEPNQPSPWSVIREAQASVAQRVPGTGFVASWDIGEKDDLHPRNKRPVGERLASLALHQVYGKPVATTGPRYAAHAVVEGKVRVSFSEVGEGLAVRGDRLTGFAIAGEDRRFFWAEAVIEGKDVVLSCPQVSRPVAVRFAYGDFWPASLFNQAGWPATPFRTDDWPLVAASP
jgi:sialate O-acetylesterase